MKKSLFSAALAASLIPSFVRAEDAAFRYQPEPAFDAIVNEAVVSIEPSDAFAGLPECRILDARLLRPYALDEAVAALKPCVAAVSRRYGQNLSAVAGTMESATGKSPVGAILIETGPAAMTSPLLRDLARSLDLRKGLLLGQPAKISREGEPAPAAHSPVQAALDGCIVTMMVRSIDSSEDFLRFYGRCLRQDAELKIRDIRPSPGRDLAVTILSAADEPTVRSLNGKVFANAGEGRVGILVLAYSTAAGQP